MSECLGRPADKEEVRQMVENFDIDNDNEINFKEFIIIMSQKVNEENNYADLMEAFQVSLHLANRR